MGGMVRDLEEQGQRHRYAIQQAQQQAAAAHAVVQGQSAAAATTGSSSSVASNAAAAGGRTSTSSTATNLGSGSASQHPTSLPILLEGERLHRGLQPVVQPLVHEVAVHIRLQELSADELVSAELLQLLNCHKSVIVVNIFL